jgi:ferredoxin
MMIITRQKSLKDILKLLRKSKNIFLIGCAQCATICKTGGDEELKQMAKMLKKEGKKVSGKATIDPACHLIKVKQFAYKNKKALSDSDAILSMTCGDGVQSIMDGTKGKKVFPALDTLFLGKLERGGHFVQKCILCGECILDKTAGICPVTVCSKGLLNSPCGGSKNGKCEIDRERDCGWALIYNRLKDTGELEKMKVFVEPLDHSKQIKPQKVIL